MVALNKSVIDDIIKNWFPVIGILFIVTGMSYLFYEGVWQKLNETGRLTLGFLTGILLISGSYPLEKKSKIIADAVLGGGLLMLYLSLIFGSRFQTDSLKALIPELWSLLIASLFTFAVAFFSYQKQSQYILLVGILGGYMTPFFIGETGSFKQFIDDKGVFHYDLPLLAFLIYFSAINFAILLVSNRFFLRGIGLLNSIGLFIGTLSLAYFMGGQFPDNAYNIAGFMLLVVALHIGSMCINAKKFSQETDPYVLIGYLLPLAWFVLNANSFLSKYIEGSTLAGLLLVCSAIYFGGWHFLRKILNQEKHLALYLGGLIGIVSAITKLRPELYPFDGGAVSTIALIFGALFCFNPLIEREISYYIFALFGTLLAFWHVDHITLPDLGIFRISTLVLIFSQIPFLLGFVLPVRKNEPESLLLYRYFSGFLAVMFILLLVFRDLIRVPVMPRSFIFFTIPAAIAYFFARKADNLNSKINLGKTTLILSGLGFFTTFVTIIDRFYPYPLGIGFLSTPESLVGLSTAVIVGLLSVLVARIKHADPDLFEESFDSLWQFMLTLVLYICLWATVSNELLAFFNTIDLHVDGVRSFAITIWWACLAAFMIFVGIKDSSLVNQKNIGFGLLSLTVIKILFIDLGYLNTSFKVFVFMLVGMLMLYISYTANKKSSDIDG